MGMVGNLVPHRFEPEHPEVTGHRWTLGVLESDKDKRERGPLPGKVRKEGEGKDPYMIPATETFEDPSLVPFSTLSQNLF